MEQQLIELYVLVCDFYDNQPNLKYQRLSNFKLRCTDEELLTMYLFGHLQGFSQQRRIYDDVRRHWHAWFPALPSYQAFNRRLNELVAAFEHLISTALETAVVRLWPGADRPDRFNARHAGKRQQKQHGASRSRSHGQGVLLKQGEL